MNTIRKAIKKSIAIEFMQIKNTGKSIRECLEFMGQEVGGDFITQEKFGDYCDTLKEKGGLPLKTLESDGEYQLAKWGSCIIKGVRGEFYPCDESIFLETYDVINDSAQAAEYGVG